MYELSENKKELNRLEKTDFSSIDLTEKDIKISWSIGLGFSKKMRMIQTKKAVRFLLLDVKFAMKAMVVVT